MPNFKYKALAADGSTVGGVVEAYDEFEAVDMIKQQNRIVTFMIEVDDPDKGFSIHKPLGNPKVKDKLLALMCSQFAIVLKAGMPIIRCVELIAQQTSDKALKKLLIQASQDVAAGYGLAQSLENKGKDRFPSTLIDTVRAGEESGTLEEAFARLHRYFEKSANTKSKVQSAMLYPIFLSVIAVVVIAIVLLVAMPVFLDMFEGMDQQLPGPTRLLIGASNFMARYWFVVVGALAALAAGIKAWSKTEKGRMFFAKTQLKLPMLGKVAQMKGASQLAGTLSTVLASGIPMIRAVAICARTLDNYYLSTQLGLAATGLEEGKPLGKCLAGADCFPPLLVEMIAMGEETGSLENTLDTIGLYFDTETETASQRALASLQPAITVVMGIIIGFVVLALYLPMFSLYQ